MEKNRRVGVKEVLGRGIVAGAIFFGANFGLVSGKHFSENPNPQEQNLVKKYQESIFGFIIKWEAEHLPHKIFEIFSKENLSPEEEIEIVNRYFETNPRDKSLEPKVEKILQQQITQVLEEEGFFIFPPVLFKFADQLNTAVIAPDDKIEIGDRILMIGGISDEEKEKIEEEIENARLHKTSFVAENSGWGFLYPPAVVRGLSFSVTREIIPHELEHPFSISTEVGRAYLGHISGIRKNDEAYVLAENIADIFGREIGNKVFEKFYNKEKVVFAKSTQRSVPSFDFSLEMRKLRVNVENLFKKGEKEEAKKVMKEKQEEFNQKGYKGRVNTARLAVYGGYQDGPSPLVDDIKSASEMTAELRESSGSLKNFVDIASKMTRFKDLEDALSQRKKLLEKEN